MSKASFDEITQNILVLNINESKNQVEAGYSNNVTQMWTTT